MGCRGAEIGVVVAAAVEVGAEFQRPAVGQGKAVVDVLVQVVGQRAERIGQRTNLTLGYEVLVHGTKSWTALVMTKPKGLLAMQSYFPALMVPTLPMTSLFET